MAIKFKHDASFSTYFLTFTCVEWIPLLHLTNTYDQVYKWFALLKNDLKADVICYVIMPNHLHLILHFHSDNFKLNSIVSNGKRFIAHETIHRLELAQNLELLKRLEGKLTPREISKGQRHKVLKDSFDAKPILTHKFLLQKINYIHNNPVSGKWMLAKDFVAYEHSSASFYEGNVPRHFCPVHYLDI